MTTPPSSLGFKLYDRLNNTNILPCFHELMRSQWLSTDEMRWFQLKRLQELLQYAQQYVPYYRQLFKRIGFQPDRLLNSPAGFQEIPTISKECIRRHRNQFLTTNPTHRTDTLWAATSGSTGTPFIYGEERRFRDYFVASALRHHTWSGWQIGQQRVYIWGSAPRFQRFKWKAQTYLKNLLWNRTYVKAYQLTEKKMTRLTHLLRKRKPQLLQVYPASLEFYARFLQQKGWDDIRIPAVFSTGEKLFPHQRQLFQEVFQCRSYNKYAALEVGAIACQCQASDAMHINTETCFVEILDDNGQPVPKGVTGNIVVTPLNNRYFPLIRYRLQDLGAMSLNRCDCRRGQPLLEVVEGRRADMFKTRDGRMVWGESLNMLSVSGIKQWQIIQESLQAIHIRLVVTHDFRKYLLDVIQQRITDVMGAGTKVTFEFFDTLPVEPGKKFRYVISKVTDEQPVPTMKEEKNG
jgi:phenylacetate-CoA ligase